MYAFAHLYTSFLNWRRGKACAKDNSLYADGVMIPYGKFLVKFAREEQGIFNVRFLLLGGFIWVISHAAVATTRRTQAPAIRAQRRAAAAQLPARAGVAGISQE